MDELKRKEASERMKKYHAEKKANMDNAQDNAQETKPVEVPVNLTPEEKAVFQRVISEDDTWLTLDNQDVDDYSLSADPFKLPEPAEKLRGDFAFRWITRSAARLDEIRNKPEIFRWWVVNRNQPRAGVFDRFIDPNYGCVSREDQMLVFKPRWLFEKEQAVKRGIADNVTSSKNLDNKCDEKGGAELVGANTISKSRLSVNSGDIQYRGESDVDGSFEGVSAEE